MSLFGDLIGSVKDITDELSSVKDEVLAVVTETTQGAQSLVSDVSEEAKGVVSSIKGEDSDQQ